MIPVDSMPENRPVLCVHGKPIGEHCLDREEFPPVPPRGLGCAYRYCGITRCGRPASEHGRFRAEHSFVKEGELHLRPPDEEPATASVSCDWGSCNELSVAWRWDDATGQGWVAVCDRHSLKDKQS